MNHDLGFILVQYIQNHDLGMTPNTESCYF